MNIGGIIESAGRLTNGQYGVIQRVRKNPITDHVEVFEGRLFEWASYVCRLNDTAVTVEPLEEYNAEHDNDTVQSLLDSLTPALTDDVSSEHYPAYDYRQRQARYGVVVEDFILNGLKVHRRTYSMFDARPSNPRATASGPGRSRSSD